MYPLSAGRAVDRNCPMAKTRGKFRIWTEYAGFLLVYLCLTRLPARIAKAFTIAMADMWRRFDKRHRLLAIQQSMDRLGISAGCASDLVRDNYRHYALFALETARLKRMPVDEVMRRTRLNGCDTIMADALSRGKGLIIVTGHLGNWEWGAVVLGRLGLVDGLIARPLDNPLIDTVLRDIRQSTGASVWDKFGSMRKALATLKKGGSFVAVMDQDGGRNGYRAAFLGKEGTTMAAPIDLAIRTGAPIFVGAMIRDSNSDTFNMVSKHVHWPIDNADPETEKRRLTTAVNSALSELVMEYPEQWIWTHRRWKDRNPRPSAST